MAKQKSNEQSNEDLPNGFDSKAMLTEAASEKNTVQEGDKVVNVGRIIKYNDRKKVQIIKDTRYYKEGQIVSPHAVMAEALIKQGIAKEAKDK